ncbi:MBL fold metallo-hydrolase [Anaerosporobacter faecicola]|uniref:MBL fold metallo-hydrolase n=1 Tax=Anaerosporobacter faecicola TaxID=2718714 RepID=UPI00143C639B|nr:MBL fold metallo-hydrolase [Anaerosporobacter faecicola]
MKAGKMEVITCIVGPVRTNCYTLVNQETKECIIVDPGGEKEKIENKIQSLQCKPVAILLTHGHFDHILAVKDLVEEYGIPVYANAEEREVLINDEYNLSVDFNGASYTCDANHYLQDGELLTLGGFTVKAIATPGHTKGGMCYYFMDEQILVTGDTLFRETVGRTDLPTSNMRQIIHSVCHQLESVADEAVVLPGHGETTTMSYERKNNPYMEGLL